MAESERLHPLPHSYYDFALPSSFPVDMVQSLSSEFEKQRAEIDWLIQIQSKRLRRSIFEEQSRLQAVIMQQYEGLMAQKDEELAMARSRGRNLQDLLRAAEIEGRGWERAAREREAVVSDLNNSLNVAKERESGYDAVSFCDSSSGGGGERKMVCKLCEWRRSCVVLWPCRHLCCCKLCEPLLEHCPLCHAPKDSTLEAFLA